MSDHQSRTANAPLSSLPRHSWARCDTAIGWFYWVAWQISDLQCKKCMETCESWVECFFYTAFVLFLGQQKDIHQMKCIYVDKRDRGNFSTWKNRKTACYRQSRIEFLLAVFISRESMPLSYVTLACEKRSGHSEEAENHSADIGPNEILYKVDCVDVHTQGTSQPAQERRGTSHALLLHVISMMSGCSSNGWPLWVPWLWPPWETSSITTYREHVTNANRSGGKKSALEDPLPRQWWRAAWNQTHRHNVL